MEFLFDAKGTTSMTLSWCACGEGQGRTTRDKGWDGRGRGGLWVRRTVKPNDNCGCDTKYREAVRTEGEQKKSGVKIR